MNKYTVNKVIGNYTQSFDKKPLLSKFGKPYINAKVTFAETGDKQVKVIKWDNVEVKEGDTFNGNVVDKEYQGKKYSELEIPKKDEVLASELTLLKFTLKRMDLQLQECRAYIKAHSEGKLPSDFSAERVNDRLDVLKADSGKITQDQEVIEPEDIPF